MIDLYYWPTPNGYKITLMLEECELEYRTYPIDIGKGDQFEPDFLKISPNNRMPALIDESPEDGGEPVELFESGAILLYLAEKVGRFCPQNLRGRYDVIKWLMWQMGGLGPMAGQNHHFNFYAPEPIPYAQSRYTRETARLYSVLNGVLDGKPFITGEYSIADMACYPWINSHERQKQDLRDFPNLKRWFESIQSRPATARAYEKGEALRRDPNKKLNAQEFNNLFGD